MSADVNRPFSCSKCKEGFTIKAFFDIHMKEAHVENGIHGCSECPCVFATDEKLNDHQVKVHDYIQSLPKIVPRKKPKDKQTSLICKHCNITFHTAGFLKTHIQRKHPNASSDDDDDDDDEEEEEDEEIKKPGLKYPRFGYDNNTNNKSNGGNQQDHDIVKEKTQDIFDRLTNGSKTATSLQSSKDDNQEEEEDVSQSGDEKSNDGRNSSSSNNRRSHRNLNSSSQKTKSYREIDDDDDDEEDDSQRKRHKKNRIESDSEDDTFTSSNKNKNTTKSSKNSFSTTNNNDADDDYGDGPNDIMDHDDDNNDYQNESNNKQQKRGNLSSSSFQITSDFSTQNDDDDMEGDDAQRSNIAQLINSIPNDDDDDNEESTISACEQCGTLYSDPQSLLNHKKTSHVVGGQYKCNMCPCVFATGPEAIVHNGIFHGSAPTLLPPEKSNDPDKNTLVEIISCEECGEDFSDPLQLTIHKVRNHGAYVPNSDANGQSSSNETIITPSHTFVTGVSTSFNHTSSYQSSTMSYPKSDFFCEICQDDYKTKSLLTNHMRICHVPNGRHPCDICPCVFNNKSSLTSHRKRHSKEIRSGSMIQTQSNTGYNSISSDNMKIIPCKICDVNFLTMADYLAHKETSHVTNGKYPCSQCLCCFATFETLKTHRVVFHNYSDHPEPSSPMVSITTVNNSTSSSSRQQQLQNYYSSPRKSYQNSQPLIDLAPNTTSDGKVECPKCGVLLSSKGSLRNHLEKSHVQNGYGCKLCPCKFQGLAGVKSHLHGIHRGIPNVGDQYYHPGEVPEDDDSSNMQYDTSSRYSNSSNNNWNSSKSYLEDEEFKCTECDWTLSDATDLQNHRIQFHGYKPNFGVRTTFTPTAVDEIINNDDPYSCSACCLTFKRKSETLSHRKRNHVLGGKFRCTLNEHTRTCRSGKCVCCKCVYSNAAALKAHEIGKHKELYIKREKEKTLQLQKKLEVRKPSPASGPKSSSSVAKPTSKPGPSEFVCNLCGRRYQLFASLGAHKNRSHKTKGVNCTQCTCTFNSQADLDLHFKKYHRHVKFAKDPVFQQPQRGRGRPKKGGGAAASASVRFTCQYAQCETQFRSQAALSNHIKSAHVGPVEVVTIDLDDDDRSNNAGGGFTTRSFPSDYDPVKLSMENPLMTASGKYACRFCNTTFSRSSAMVAHVKTFHMEADKLVCFECTDSEEQFSNLAELTLHRQQAHGHETFDTSLQDRNSSSNDHERTPIITNCTSLQGVSDSGYVKPDVPRCELCGRVFSHSRSLWSHRKRSHVNGNFNCTEPECTSRSCGFGTARGLRNHLLIFHGIRDDSLCTKKDEVDTDGWLIDCWECELTFTSNWKLEQHKKRCHVTDGEFPCEECDCVFSTSTAMNIHKLKKHGLELPPYVPPVDELSLQNDDLEESNNLTKEKSSSTPGKSSSKMEYPCTQCGMIFSLTSALQSHLEQAHVKNGAFPCTECNCRFASSATLAQHILGHNLRTKLNTQEQQSNSNSPAISTESKKRGRPSSTSKATTSSSPSTQSPKVAVAKKKTSGPPPPKTDIVGMALAAAMGSTASIASTSASTSKPASSGLACTTCKKAGFPSASVLRRHEVQCKKRTNRPSKTPLECKFCSRKFTLVISLQEHMKLKHAQGGKSTDSPKRGTVVDMVDLDSDDDGVGDFHDTSMPSPPREMTPPPPPPPPKKRKTKFPCKECEIIFPKSRILKTHKMVCHVKNGTLSCDAVKCTCKFNLPWALYFHKKYQHDPNKPIKKNIKKKKKKKKAVEKKNEEKDKEQENDKETVTLDEKTGETIDAKTGKKILSLKEKRLLRKIRKGFFSRRTLKNREKLINGIERRHPCGVCAVKFRWPYQLARHERINHPGSPEYLCEKCPSMTALSQELRHHEIIYHSHFLNMRQVFNARKRMKLNNGTAAVPSSSTSTTVTNASSSLNVPVPQSSIQQSVVVPTLSNSMIPNSMIPNPMNPTPMIPSMMQTIPSSSTSFIDSMIMKTFNPFKMDENVPLDLSNVIASYSMGGSGVLSGADITAGFSGQHGIMMKNKLLRRKLRRKKGIHMCRICRMMFFTKKRLSSHLRIHVGEKPFKCRFCAVKFRTYGEYYFHKKKHIAMKAGGKEPVERTPLGRCSYCSATFRTKFLQDCHFDECHPELKFLDMCEQASNLWKEVSKVGPGDNINSVI